MKLKISLVVLLVVWCISEGYALSSQSNRMWETVGKRNAIQLRELRKHRFCERTIRFCKKREIYEKLSNSDSHSVEDKEREVAREAAKGDVEKVQELMRRKVIEDLRNAIRRRVREDDQSNIKDEMDALDMLLKD